MIIGLSKKGVNVFCWALFLVLSSAYLFVANSATFTVEAYKEHGHYIKLDGEIVEGDLDRLKLAASDDRLTINPTLIMRSPGGDGREMKKIVEYMKTTKFKTRVFNDSRCMSACAVIWSHGSTRYFQETNTIGYHVSSVSGPGVKDFIDAHGYMGFQSYVQESFANDLLYYAEFPVLKPLALVSNIVKDGYTSDKFYILNEEDADNIIGVTKIK